MPDDLYRRKISAEEAKERYILIVKRGLDVLPKAGKPFTLKVKDKEFKIYLEPFEVWSMGPKKPQLHYRINAKQFWDDFPLQFGKTVTISKESDKKYILS